MCGFSLQSPVEHCSILAMGRLPHAEQALVEQRKVLGYLLSDDHPDGLAKARFFKALGFSADRWQEFSEALIKHALESQLVSDEATPYGRRYVVEGVLTGPKGREAPVRTVWIQEGQSKQPRLVTAYPVRKA